MLLLRGWSSLILLFREARPVKPIIILILIKNEASIEPRHIIIISEAPIEPHKVHLIEPCHVIIIGEAPIEPHKVQLLNAQRLKVK
jgi:hypothetical protein